tara:strand:- start:3319 stop:3540 length:222 start_codon:yes stop_codon:yes gene_type:complete
MIRNDEIETLNDFSSAIADYLVEEYDDALSTIKITDTQRNLIGGIVNYCYDNDDSINNTASHLMSVLRKISHL